MVRIHDVVADLNAALGDDSIMIEAVKSHAKEVVREQLSSARKQAIDEVNQTFDKIIEDTARYLQAHIRDVYRSHDSYEVIVNLSINGGLSKKLKTKQVLVDVPVVD